MKKLTKWIYIILLLVLIIVLVFYVLNRLGVRTPLSNINKQYCGDQICQLNENHDNCCMDCGCLNNKICINNKCQISMTTSTTRPPDTTQTTIGSAPSGKETEPSGETPSETTTITQTTSTTIYIGCSYNNCEACENTTACYNVGCVWCISDRCLRICKGQISII